MSGFNYLINRLITYPMTEHNKITEVKTTEHMLEVNNYCYLNLHDQIKCAQRRLMQPIKHDINNQKKWATFAYIGRETKSITKLFKDQNINIVYSTNNTLEKHSGPKISKMEPWGL
jgi:regulator of PEP synthase PpsR (kinase-PPPase family)